MNVSVVFLMYAIEKLAVKACNKRVYLQWKSGSVYGN